MSESLENLPSVEVPVPEVDEERFRQNMKEGRESRGWSQGELSKRLIEAGWPIFHQTTISRIESGDRPVKLGEARAIAAILGRTLSDMVVPAVEALRLHYLEREMKSLRESREEIDRAVSRLEVHQAQLRHTIEMIDEQTESGWEDPTLKAKTLRGREIAQVLLGWTPESIIAAFRRERDETKRRAAAKAGHTSGEPGAADEQ